MSKINRYEIDDHANFDGVYYYAELKENKNGDYCKWSEVKELETQLAEKNSEIERLKAGLIDIKKIIELTSISGAGKSMAVNNCIEKLTEEAKQ